MNLLGYVLSPLGIDVLKLAIPIAIGLAIWFVQTLAQRAWSEYETRRDIYRDVIKHVDSLFEGGTRADRVEFLRAVRQVWLVGSDEVVLAGNNLTASIRSKLGSDILETRYREFIAAMRTDLRKRRWLPPSGTKLGPENFPLEGPGA